jgi:hypothetical protein
MTWQRDSSAARYIWSYRVYENQVRMTVRAEAIYGHEVVAGWQANNWSTAGGLCISSNARWDLYTEARSWSSLRIKITVWLDNVSEFAERVFPPERRPNAGFCVQARCGRTRWRQSEVVAIDSGKAEMTISAESDDLYGELEILPTITLLGDVSDVADGFAGTCATIIANGFSVSIWTTEPGTTPGKGIRRVWQPFPSYSDALYKLSIEETGTDLVPILFFNSNHPLLKSVIDFRGRKQPNAAARDSLFAMIATDVWMQLAAFAVGVEMEQEAATDTPESQLAVRIVATLRRKLRRTRSDIVAAFDTDAGRSELNTAIQDWLKTAQAESQLMASFQDQTSN